MYFKQLHKVEHNVTDSEKLIMSPITNKLLCFIFSANLIANVVALGKKEMVNGKEHVVITSLDIKPEVGHLDLVLDNLFPKNSELTENANKLLNDNQNVIVEEFSPLVVNIIKEFLLSVLRNIFKYYSFDVLFPNA